MLLTKRAALHFIEFSCTNGTLSFGRTFGRTVWVSDWLARSCCWKRIESSSFSCSKDKRRNNVSEEFGTTSLPANIQNLLLTNTVVVVDAAFRPANGWLVLASTGGCVPSWATVQRALGCIVSGCLGAAQVGVFAIQVSTSDRRKIGGTNSCGVRDRTVGRLTISVSVSSSSRLAGIGIEASVSATETRIVFKGTNGSFGNAGAGRQVGRNVRHTDTLSSRRLRVETGQLGQTSVIVVAKTAIETHKGIKLSGADSIGLIRCGTGLQQTSGRWESCSTGLAIIGVGTPGCSNDKTRLLA